MMVFSHLPGWVTRPLRSAFQSPFLERFARAVTHPAFCWLAAFVVLVGWHIPAIFMLGLQSETWHLVEQASFFVAGLLFWWPVIRPSRDVSSRPGFSIILYLFLATLPCDILSAFLVFCDRVVYPVYFSSSHLFGFSALDDQQCAGALMWTSVTVVYLVAGTFLTMQLLSPSLQENDMEQSRLGGGVTPQKVLQSLEVL